MRKKQYIQTTYFFFKTQKWLFAVLYGLKIVVQLGSGYVQEINIDPECDFPQELVSSFICVASAFRSYYKLPTQNSEEP